MSEAAAPFPAPRGAGPGGLSRRMIPPAGASRRPRRPEPLVIFFRTLASGNRQDMLALGPHSGPYGRVHLADLGPVGGKVPTAARLRRP
ncbi:MAG TPA: hypothetical protein VES73_00780 [Lamprocystis sp. (in: g-proteobacteria)]|nr:hypothetical protein [Lamprocystis sp. (in: g-proteobacteria)]